jgi:hypothetical protein
MERIRFTAEEAGEKVGRRVKSVAEFAGVPKGTTGRVVGAEEAPGGFDVEVEWEQPDRLRPLRDWVTKDEYEQKLTEV